MESLLNQIRLKLKNKHELMDYNKLIDAVIDKMNIDLDGDIVEIGAFVGKGTRKLAERFRYKDVIAIDIFKPEVDKDHSGLYKKLLGGRNQRVLFDENTKGLDNIKVIETDTMGYKIPTNKIFFAIIDGNHTSEYVINDFNMVWPKVVTGGLVIFDDFSLYCKGAFIGICEILARHHGEISEIFTIPFSPMLFIRKGEPEKWNDTGVPGCYD